MWADDLRCGPGMIVSSTGTYCEATFASGTIAVSTCNVYDLWSRFLSHVPDLISWFSESDLVQSFKSLFVFSATDLVPSSRSLLVCTASDLVPCPKSHSMFRASGLILRPLGMQSQSSTKIERPVATMLSYGISDLLHVYVCTHHIFLFVCLFVCLFLCRVDTMAL